MIKITCETWLVIFGTLLAIFLRCCTTLHPYSGEGMPPMYGDYEAQRHWMEITTNLPLNQWYRNTTDNDLQYWGLDYPPLTAYHMFICGLASQYLLHPNCTQLHSSRGFENPQHRLFMRYTVLISDIAIFIPAMIYYYSNVDLRGELDRRKKVSSFSDAKPMPSSLCIVLALFYPGIILIDHGHFQYNCISLGLTIFATTFILIKQNILASIAFCLALNYKQMELYHALPFFLYLLSICVPKPGQNSIAGVIRLMKIALTVVVTFIVVWLPFLFDLDGFFHVLQRQFPVARGVFEDKVSNLWCTLNIFYKFKQKFDNYQMMRLCLFTTLSALLPSCADLFLRPNLKKFVLALINSSLAFFLFSFQVHEKSILLVAIPVVLYFPYAPFVCFWFLCISIFSMLPLLIKDDLIIAFVALMIFYLVSFRVSVEHAYRSSLNASDGFAEYYRNLLHILLDLEYKKSKEYAVIKLTYKQIVKNKDALKMFAFKCILLMSLLGCVVLFLMALTLNPPQKYPDLFPLLISVYSCVHFLGFFIYFNYKQMKIPQQFEDIKNVRLKSS